MKNATIWTSGPDGVIENGDLLIENGRVVRVGKGLTASAGATTIDATGKHVSPGLIDCHSHAALARGVNEGSHSVTVEVRVGDAIDPTDIALYWQLAGGLKLDRLAVDQDPLGVGIDPDLGRRRIANHVRLAHAPQPVDQPGQPVHWRFAVG